MNSATNSSTPGAGLPAAASTTQQGVKTAKPAAKGKPAKARRAGKAQAEAAAAPVDKKAGKAASLTQPARPRVPSKATEPVKVSKAAKPAKVAAVTVQSKVAKPVKLARNKVTAEVVQPAAHKVKLVRDSFTMPELEYTQLGALKRRALALAHHVKKSELLRAGVATLAAMNDETLMATLQAVPPLKTGRPKGV